MQVAKNIVLAGVGNVGILDDTPCRQGPGRAVGGRALFQRVTGFACLCSTVTPHLHTHIITKPICLPYQALMHPLPPFVPPNAHVLACCLPVHSSAPPGNFLITSDSEPSSR